MTARKTKKSTKSTPLLRNRLFVPIIVAFIIGSVFSYVIVQPQVSDLKTNEDVLNSQILFLENQLSDLKEKESKLTQSQIRVDELQSQVNLFEQEHKQLTQEISSLNNEIVIIETELVDKKEELSLSVQQAELSETELVKLNSRLDLISDTIIKFDNDKLLLVELRKEIPTTRFEALDHWKRVKDIAVTSDPNLGPSVDKVISMVDAYYDWIEQQPGVNSTDAEFFDWIVQGNISGALNYTSEIGKFQNDALLTVIIRMDAALSLVA